MGRSMKLESLMLNHDVAFLVAEMTGNLERDFVRHPLSYNEKESVFEVCLAILGDPSINPETKLCFGQMAKVVSDDLQRFH